jgi:hypothetical protein
MLETRHSPKVLHPSLIAIRAAAKGMAGRPLPHHPQGSAHSGQSFAMLGTVRDGESSYEGLGEPDVYREGKRCAIY